MKKAGMRWGEVSELARRKKEMKGRGRGERLGKGREKSGQMKNGVMR